ncbi:MAG: hypothetical protein AAF678_04025 [Pseudomonadota bacterium]
MKGMLWKRYRVFWSICFFSVLSFVIHPDKGQACDAACLAARKAANPLADTRALITDSTLAFRTGTNDEDSYNAQLQPLYSIDLTGANLVLRGIIPFQGVQPGAVLPPSVPDPTPGNGRVEGLGDISVQAFYAPQPGEDGLALGYGLQTSFRTRTDSALAGAGWGAGPAFVVFGQTGDLSWGGVVAHMWGEESFSTTIFQPIVTYGLGQGWYVGYNNVISYNWNARSGDEAWSVPVGLTAGKTTVLNEESGTALDLSLGYYALERRPQGGPDSQIKLGVSLFF